MEDKKEKLEGLLIALDNLRETMTRAIGELSDRVEDALKEVNEESEVGSLIPFDIEKAKQGAKVVTTLRRNVRILCYDRTSHCYPIIALIENKEDGEDEIESYTEDGNVLLGQVQDTDLRILE